MGGGGWFEQGDVVVVVVQEWVGWVVWWRVVGGGWRGVVGCHAVPLLPELAVQPCVLRLYTRDGIIDNG